MRGALEAAVDEAARRFALHDSDIARSLAQALQGLRAAETRTESKSHPACGALAGLIEGSDDALARLIAASAPALAWRAPGFGRLSAALGDRIAVAELVGPTGAIPHDRIRFGALVQSAGCLYPDHSHAAEELYLVVAGRALWSLDGGTPTPNGPNAFVHHRPWRPHAIETGAEAMLALWGWTGDIGGDSYRLVPGADARRP